MPKVERLVKLARLTRDREALSIAEMSEACGVSQRTIYRYLNTLSGLDFAAAIPTSSRPRSGAGGAAPDWSPEDLSLLCYSLQNNPLAAYPFFRRRLKRVRESLLAGAGCVDPKTDHGAMRFARTGSGAAHGTASKLLERFEKARQRSVEVKLQLAGRQRKSLRLSPRAIRVAGERVFLEFAVPNQRKKFQIDLRQVRQMTISRRRSVGRNSGRRSAR